nr:MAG TPA: hypothetical protein [Caudoviricetes sp.]
MLSCFISFFNFFILFRVFLYPTTFTLTVRATGFSIISHLFSFIMVASYAVSFWSDSY